jgi:tetratricopeptide (TPR) repeat protein
LAKGIGTLHGENSFRFENRHLHRYFFANYTQEKTYGILLIELKEVGMLMSVKSDKVIPLRMTAEFFNERATRSLNQYNYSKALRYYKRAVDVEPDNPSHFCNMAGVLAQLGQFKESNELLFHVLYKVDTEMSLCHYYLACNFANMDYFDKAEKHALLYLANDPEGRFANEALDLLSFVAEIPEDSPLLRDKETVDEFIANELASHHDRARKMLEEGNFDDAERLLQQLFMDNPDFLAAGNNLSLCYYYMGKFEDAMDTISFILEQDPYNIHALCNLAILFSHYKQASRLEELLGILKKIIPMQYDQAYKLGITLGIMGDHEAAYFLFKKMVKFIWDADFHLLHYCAVAAYNTGRYQVAKKYWKLVQVEDEESLIATYYLEQLEKKDQEQTVKDKIPYYYHLPTYDKKIQKQPAREAALQEKMKKTPLASLTYHWALRFGDREMKEQVLSTLEWINDKEMIETLQAFVNDQREDWELRERGQFILGMLGFPSPLNLNTPYRWHKNWLAVVEMLDLYISVEHVTRAKEIWVQFIQLSYPDVPVIRKPEAWSAALEWFAKGKDVTLVALARKYEVTTQTIKKNILVIEEIVFHDPGEE